MDELPSGAVETPRAVAAAKRLSILLVDDHVMVREGLRALLALQPDLEVVGEAHTCGEAVELSTRLQPDVVLTDIGLPDRSGLHLVSELRKVCPTVRVVLLTALATEEYIRAGLDARADGYVLKDTGHTELVLAIRTVATGQHYLCRAVASRVLETYLDRDGRKAQEEPLRLVTRRERQVLIGIGTGKSNKTLAHDLGLSIKTVEKHRANLMRKLALHNASDITRFALKHRLLSQEDPATQHARHLLESVGT
ncbi:MAG: response regulator transcription factor [Steroidobacteraceae bacterium]